MDKTLKVGDVIKLKIRGFVTEAQVLGPHDVIQPGDFWCHIFDEEPLCYQETLNTFMSRRTSDRMFFNSECVGETISNNHTKRIYIRPLKIGGLMCSTK